MIVKLHLERRPPSADFQQPGKRQQPQRLPQHPMQRQRSGEGKEVLQKAIEAPEEPAEALPVRIVKPCIFNRASTPEIDRLISDGAGSEPQVLPYSDSSCTEEVSIHESLHDQASETAQNVLQNGSPAQPRCEVGPVRKGLPMTRRGVAQLLKQHEVAPDELSLCGAAVKPSKIQRRPATASSREVQIHHIHSEPSPQAQARRVRLRLCLRVAPLLRTVQLCGRNRPRGYTSRAPSRPSCFQAHWKASDIAEEHGVAVTSFAVLCGWRCVPAAIIFQFPEECNHA